MTESVSRNKYAATTEMTALAGKNIRSPGTDMIRMRTHRRERESDDKGNEMRKNGLSRDNKYISKENFNA